MCVLHALVEHSALKEEQEIYLNASNVLLEEFVILKVCITYHKQLLVQMVQCVLLVQV
jgi:hypothetical protein